MKLLLDQNISHRLVAPLQNSYPDSSQVALLGLGEASDLQIWELAQSQDYVIVSNDADFEAISVLEGGGPPLIIWLRCGNQPRRAILDRLLSHRDTIERAEGDPEIWCIEIY